MLADSVSPIRIFCSIWDRLMAKREIRYLGVNDNLLSLRGFAAVSVLVFHAMLAFKVDGLDTKIFTPIDLTTPAHIVNQLVVLLTNGGAAVTFFFVHSGFVLTLSLNQHYRKALPFHHSLLLTSLSYYIRRVFRLYPVILVSVMAGYAFYHLLFVPLPNPPSSAWLNGFFQRGGGLQELYYNLMLLSHTLNKFLWSLLVETQLSILMPLLYLAVRRNLSAVMMGLLLAGAIVSEYASELQRLTMVEPSVWVIHKFSFTFVLCFFLGAVATTVPHAAPSAILRLGRVASAIFRHRIILCLLVLIGVRPLSGLQMEYAILIEMMAAVVIVHDVYYCNSGWLQRIASHRISRFYGRISYSLYMFSGICIYASAMATYHFLGGTEVGGGLVLNISVTLLSLILVTLVSAASYSWVERPLMRLGKDISRKLER